MRGDAEICHELGHEPGMRPRDTAGPSLHRLDGNPASLGHLLLRGSRFLKHPVEHDSHEPVISMIFDRGFY